MNKVGTKRLLKKLAQLTKEKGTVIVAMDLGYRSPNTIRNWINKETIPDLAILNVKKYVEDNYDSVN